jgi:hypothetical protein
MNYWTDIPAAALGGQRIAAGSRARPEKLGDLHQHSCDMTSFH